METKFNIVASVIKNRRTTKPSDLNGQLIPDEQIMQLLELADWAPSHGLTEPWRFIVYPSDKVKDFCTAHASLYKEHTNHELFSTAVYEKLAHQGDTASHIIVCIMQRGHKPKIPVLEEIAATSAAIEHILLGAESLGISTIWSTGGMAHHPSMKALFSLNEEDIIMGVIYCGYSTIEKQGKRTIPITEKVKWMK